VDQTAGIQAAQLEDHGPDVLHTPGRPASWCRSSRSPASALLD
jgi:hypothetical protein